jgi:tight adherence protein B
MTESALKALILACIFGAVLLGVEALVSWLGRSRSESKAINLRLRMIGEGKTHGETLNLLRRAESALPQGLPPLLARLGRKFESMLIAAQVTIPTGRLMIVILTGPVVLFFVIVLIMVFAGIPVAFGRLLLIATFSGAIGAALPLMFLNFKANRTRKRMQEQFPVALDVFVRGLRAGHPIAAALDLLTVEMPDPIGSQFGIVVDEVTYGADLRDALQSMADRWALDDMRMFVVSLSVQNETGGNLAEILDNLAGVVRERFKIRRQVRVHTAHGRFTGYVLMALPAFLAVALMFINPEHMNLLFEERVGQLMILACIVMQGIGFIWIKQIVKIEV